MLGGGGCGAKTHLIWVLGCDEWDQEAQGHASQRLQLSGSPDDRQAQIQHHSQGCQHTSYTVGARRIYTHILSYHLFMYSVSFNHGINQVGRSGHVLYLVFHLASTQLLVERLLS